MNFTESDYSFVDFFLNTEANVGEPHQESYLHVDLKPNY